MGDINIPAKHLSVNYELLNYECVDTFMDATPPSTSKVKKVDPFPEGPVGGRHVADLAKVPLAPARQYNDRAWKPKGRR